GAISAETGKGQPAIGVIRSTDINRTGAKIYKKVTTTSGDRLLGDKIEKGDIAACSHAAFTGGKAHANGITLYICTRISALLARPTFTCALTTLNTIFGAYPIELSALFSWRAISIDLTFICLRLSPGVSSKKDWCALEPTRGTIQANWS